MSANLPDIEERYPLTEKVHGHLESKLMKLKNHRNHLTVQMINVIYC